MFLRAGVVSVVLLLFSRVLGLARESALAAAFGVGPLADAVVLMLTLPDVLVGVALSGAMAYVLLPHWAKLPEQEALRHQARTWWVFGGVGLLIALAMWALAPGWAQWLSPGLAQADGPLATKALRGAAWALPWAFLAAVLGAQLQHRADMVGMYAANLLVNAVLLCALFWLTSPWARPQQSHAALSLMIVALVVGMLARVAWQTLRLGAGKLRSDLSKKEAVRHYLKSARVTFYHKFSVPAPRGADWAAAAIVAGVPLVVYLVARSLASREGPGALTVFNYAWKLVELPQLLVVQVLAVLALPVLSRAVAQPGAGWVVVFRRAFGLAWVLACAATVALQWGSGLLAQALYGWGRMNDAALAQVAQWSALGALCLLPAAAVAMWLALLASLGQLHRVAVAWLFVGLLAALAGNQWVHGGRAAMVWLCGVWGALAGSVAWQQRVTVRRSVPWQELAWPTGVALLGGLLANCIRPLPWWQLVLAGGACVACTLLTAWRRSPSFQQAIRRDGGRPTYIDTQ
jgi:peptidoglycan biosynthesis protein MviN/MurJ (putative lipid II flippase)